LFALLVVVLLFAFLAAAFPDRDAATGAREERRAPTTATRPAVDSYLEMMERHFALGALRVYGPEELRDIPLVLRGDEVVIYAAAQTATFCEERSERVFGGGSVRVVGSVRVFGGGATQVPRLAPVDEGRALLTNQRVVFLGRLRTLEVPIERLVGMRYDDTALVLHASGRAKTVQIQAPGESLILGRNLEYLLSREKWFLARYEDSVALVWEGSQISRGCA
jgi:hypothetical protein